MRFDRPPFPTSPPAGFSALATTILVALFVAACDRPPTPLRDWTAADHDHADDKGKPPAGGPAAARGPASAADEAAALVEMAWSQNCLKCHGPMGRGDGPEGPMSKTPDLTREEWQAKVTDAEIATQIRLGKNKMPKFDLPESVVAGLIARIRASRGR